MSQISIKEVLKISSIECFWGDVGRWNVRVILNCSSLFLGLRLSGQGGRGYDSLVVFSDSLVLVVWVERKTGPCFLSSQSFP